MSNNYPVQWIEQAEARRFCENVAANPHRSITERQYLHLGERVAKISALGQWVGKEMLSAVRNSYRHAHLL
jgi:hypothetical protein